jgi:tryptophan synthase alpha chain
MFMDLEETFRNLSNIDEGAFMPHIYYGDPNTTFSQKLIMTLVESGADILEIGIPFSDPTADGPTFQAACERSLKNGTSPMDCIHGIKLLRERGISTPIILTTYYNIPYTMGIKRFLDEIKTAGIQGVIIPNLPIEEAEHIVVEGRENGIHTILQVAPTTNDDRLKSITAKASGFIYIINLEGVTGARNPITESTINLIKRVRKFTDTPLLAGFGISTGEHANTLLKAGVNGIIAGSVFARIYEKHLDNPEDSLEEIAQIASQIKEGCKQPK